MTKVIVTPGTREYQAALRTLTFIGTKHGGLVFGDLGLAENWTAYTQLLDELNRKGCKGGRTR